jgi:ketosteroid isomerase-like protein
MATDTEAVARRLVDEYNRGSPDWVEALHAPTTEWIELPFLGGSGRQGGRAALRKAAEDQVANFPDRRMEIVGIVGNATQVALEVEWTGTAAVATAWAPAGARLRLRAVMMLTIADARVVREVDYVIPMPSEA